MSRWLSLLAHSSSYHLNYLRQVGQLADNWAQLTNLTSFTASWRVPELQLFLPPPWLCLPFR
jgi:hypothetical protein